MSETIDAEFRTRDEAPALPAIIDDNIVAIAEAAEKRVEAIKKIKSLALRVTNASDWTDQNGKCYLAVSGAEKVARLFGISWQIDEPVCQHDEDGHYSYTYKGRFSMQGITIEAEGARSSKDGFFSRRKNRATGEMEDLPPLEVDRVNVRKAALTNCLGNGITRLLGIRNMTWDELAQAGIKRDAVQGVEYQKTEMSAEAQNQKTEIQRMLLRMADDDPQKAADLLEQATGFTGRDGNQVKGKRDLGKLSEKAVQVTYGKVKTAYERRFGKDEDKQSAVAGEGKADGKLV